MQAWHWHLAIIEEKEENEENGRRWLLSRGARRIALTSMNAIDDTILSLICFRFRCSAAGA